MHAELPKKDSWIFYLVGKFNGESAMRSNTIFGIHSQD